MQQVLNPETLGTPGIQIDLRIDDPRWPEAGFLNPLINQSVFAAIECAKLRMEPDAELSLLFTSDKAVRALNQQWRKIDNPTNVLSFPAQDLGIGEIAGNQLGDICFAYETITTEASLEHKSFDHHFSHLMVHGFLHLFGYDHLNDVDAQAMENLETKILAQLGIPDPYN